MPPSERESWRKVTEIFELKGDDQFERAFKVMHELRLDVDEVRYQDLLVAMRNDGYRLFAAGVDGEIVALAGIAFRTNFYYGRYLWVYDLITTESERSRGHGAALLEHLEELAKKRGCDTIALASGLQRTDAHRFYQEKMDYEQKSYVFVKPLS